MHSKLPSVNVEGNTGQTQVIYTIKHCDHPCEQGNEPYNLLRCHLTHGDAGNLTADLASQHPVDGTLGPPSAPPPLPPRSTRPDYGGHQQLSIGDASDSVTDATSILYSDSDESDAEEISSTVAEADNEDPEDKRLWSRMPALNFDDEAFNRWFEGLSLGRDGTPRLEPARERVPSTPRRKPVIGPLPSTPTTNQVAGQSRVTSLPPTPNKTGKGKWYVVTKGANVGVFDNWCVFLVLVSRHKLSFYGTRHYVAHITRMKGSIQKGYDTFEEARTVYEESVELGVVETLN